MLFVLPSVCLSQIVVRSRNALVSSELDALELNVVRARLSQRADASLCANDARRRPPPATGAASTATVRLGRRLVALCVDVVRRASSTSLRASGSVETHAHRRDRRSIAARILDCSLRLLRARSQLTTSLPVVVLRVAESVTRLHSFARYRLVRRSFDLIRRYDLLLPRSSSVERCSVTAARLLGNDRCQSARAGVDVVLTRRRHRRPTVAL